jgi:hypothetical protein
LAQAGSEVKRTKALRRVGALERIGGLPREHWHVALDNGRIYGAVRWLQEQARYIGTPREVQGKLEEVRAQRRASAGRQREAHTLDAAADSGFVQERELDPRTSLIDKRSIGIEQRPQRGCVALPCRLCGLRCRSHNVAVAGRSGGTRRMTMCWNLAPPR